MNIANTDHIDTTNSTYRVVFSGNTLSGHSVRDVAIRFGKQFKLQDTKVLATLFSGQMIALKRNLSYDRAQQYNQLLRELGADCCIERERSPFSFTQDIDEQQKPRRRNPSISSQALMNATLIPK